MNITIDGCSISYKITGDGNETVVMLQGWGTDLGVYDSIAAILNSKYRFVQFDFPGFGSSDEPKEAWNVDAYADFFCKLMQELEISEATLIGHSYGGRVIIKLAARESLPFKIRNIVLIDSAGIVPKKTFSQKMKIAGYKVMKKIFSLELVCILFPELVEDWRNRQGSADYRNASPLMRKALVMAVNEDLTHLLPKIRQETLLIWGEKDTATPMSDARTMERLIPDCGLVELKGAGHFSFLEQPVIFSNVMRSYFKIGA